MRRLSFAAKIRTALFFSVIALAFVLTPTRLAGQIYEPEGINMPGDWNGWANPPVSNLALASATQVTNGRVTKITKGTPRWQTIFSVAASGGDLTGGSYEWLFTSGSLTNPWGNKWAGVAVTHGVLQNYSYNSGSNNTVTLTNGKWYTVNWNDIGYAATSAIFMETSAEPVLLTNISAPATAAAGQPVDVALTTSSTPSAGEKFFLIYSVNNWATSLAAEFLMTGATGVATIPGQAPGSTVRFYALSSTVSGITSNFNLYTIHHIDNGGSNYSCTINGLSSEAEIVSFSLPGQTGPATIDTQAATVEIEVAWGTILTALVPDFTISTGASVDPPSAIAQDFSVPVHYLVTAEDETTTKDWTVTVTVASPPPAEFGLRDDGGVNLPTLTYWYTGLASDITEKGSVFNNKELGVVNDLYLKGSAIKSWKNGAGNVTGARFNYKVWRTTEPEPVDYSVRNVAWTSDDGGGDQTWAGFGVQIPVTDGLTDGNYNLKIMFSIEGTGVAGTTTDGPFLAVFTYEQFSSQAEIVSFTLPEQTGPAVINSTGAAVNLEVAFGTSPAALAPVVSVSAGATCNPESGTMLDFTSPVVYTVTAENGTTVKTWTVTISVAPPVISWANLEWPASGLIQPAQSFNVYAQVYALGVTAPAGQGAGVEAWIGYSTANTDPATWTNWIPAAYHGDALNNDEYSADLGAAIPSVGTYYYASRFSLNAGAYVYGGYNVTDGGFWDGTINQSGVLTVSNPVISWANLQFPGSAAKARGEDFDVYGQVLVPGFSGQTTPVSGLSTWVGVSTENTDPATWTNWTPATYVRAAGANDEFSANVGSVLTADGIYYYSTRYQLNSGDYVYGGFSATGGGFWDGTVNINGSVTVTSPPINWASLHWPENRTIEPGQPFSVYGRAWIEGHTGQSQPFQALQAWVGYHSENTDPATWTNWIDATYNTAAGNNDEFVANLGEVLTTDGTFYYATRFRVYDHDYVYGGYSSTGGGFWDGTNQVNGVVTVGFDIDCSLYSGVALAEPPMPLANENVTIYFDVTKGNGALLNYTGDVYAHTAVLTNLSYNSSDWRYTKTNWGVNTPATKLTRLSANSYSLTIETPRTYYGVPSGETIRSMVFVLRSDVVQAGGSFLEHRNADGSDIAVEVFEAGLHVRLDNPSSKQTILNQPVAIPVCASAIGNNQLRLYINNSLLSEQAGGSLSYMLIGEQFQAGQNWLKAVAQNGTGLAADSVEIYFRGPVIVADLPAGAHNGINYINDSTVTLVLHDPTGFKQFVYAIGEFGNWQLSNENYMKRTPDGKRYWTTITGLEPGEEYAFQYLIDGTLKIADPYAELVLDPWNDQWISTATYPGLKPYPSGQTDGVVSVLQTAQPPFDWQVTNFIPPAVNNAQSDLVIYELLIRDFVESRNIADVQQKLDYLKDLGVNAVQLMPIAEFDGNESWGYSPNFFFATDKYYGTRNAYKTFIDEAHQRGIAVILDIVPNHAFGLCPMVQMYFNQGANQPSEHNPWFNQQSPHGFSVGYDFNHESGHTRQFFKDVFQYWLTEFKVDGFRIDLSKGLTQKYTGGDIGAWNAYDQSRVNILNDYKAHIKWVNPNAYIILEHFADNSEETVLANSGMLLWSAMHGNYKQVSMGWENNSNVSWAFHGTRGWSYPNLVDYMETHDEERMMAEALSNGNSSNPMYDIKYFGNALHHQEQAMVLFMGIPGPKMLYQFQEMGYDYSILYGGGRTANKPPRWDYLDVPGRERLTRVVSAMAALRKSDAFRYGSFYHDLSLSGKKMWITHSSMDVIVTVNMGVGGFDMAPGFTKAGTWYDYFTGESFYVSDPGGHFFFYGPGDYKVFTSEPRPKPFHDLEVVVTDSETGNPLQGVTVSLSDAGQRITGADGKAVFLSLPQAVSLTARKFGWLSQTVDTVIGTNTYLSMALEPGWDQADSWVNLEWPGTGQIEPGDDYDVYAQVWIDGITDQALPATDLEVWIGYSETDTDPSTWTNWLPATYDAAIGNNDQYKANPGTALTAEGTYYYASRFRHNGGVFVYGGYSTGNGGFWNGTTNLSGVVTVELPEIGWANLQYPASGQIDPLQDFQVYARAYIQNKTGSGSATAGLDGWVGYSTVNSNPATWTNWVPAAFNASMNNNDEYVANIGAQITGSGTYYYASRFRYKTGEFVYGGYSTSGGGFWNGTSITNGVLIINQPPPTVIDWANLQWPANGSISPGGEFLVYGRAYVADLTPLPGQASGLQAWVGYSTQNTNPATWTNWLPATFYGAAGNNDEFVGNPGAQITVAGTYYYAYRYRLNNGAFYYGGYSALGGGFWNGTTMISGVLTVAYPEKTLNLTSIFPEGLYLGDGLLRQAQQAEGPQFAAGIADVVSIELRESGNYNNLLLALPDVPLSTAGEAEVLVPGTYGGLYYITVKHRNSIEVTTASPVDFSGTTVARSFGSQSLVYGANLLLAPDGHGLIYTGDINQDGVVDDADMTEVTTHSAAFSRGYLVSDLNGDGVTDGIDMILLDNNAARQTRKWVP